MPQLQQMQQLMNAVKGDKGMNQLLNPYDMGQTLRNATIIGNKEVVNHLIDKVEILKLGPELL